MGADTFCCAHLTRAGQLENAGWWPGRSPGLLCASQEGFPTALAPKWEPWCVPELWRSPQSPQQRGGTRGACTHPPGTALPQPPFLSSLPHQWRWGTVCNPWRTGGQLTLEKGRMYEFDTLFVFLLSPIPKSAIKSFLLLAINCTQISDSQMFCLRQVCCWFYKVYHTPFPYILSNAGVQ